MAKLLPPVALLLSVGSVTPLPRRVAMRLLISSWPRVRRTFLSKATDLLRWQMEKPLQCQCMLRRHIVGRATRHANATHSGEEPLSSTTSPFPP